MKSKLIYIFAHSSVIKSIHLCLPMFASFPLFNRGLHDESGINKRIFAFVPDQVRQDICTHGTADSKNFSATGLAVFVIDVSHWLQNIHIWWRTTKLWWCKLGTSEPSIVNYNHVISSLEALFSKIPDVYGARCTRHSRTKEYQRSLLLSKIHILDISEIFTLKIDKYLASVF